MAINPPATQDAGEIIRKARRDRDISQQTLAKQIGRHQSVISNIENGNRKVTTSEWLIFCEYLKIRVDAIAPQQNPYRHRH